MLAKKFATVALNFCKSIRQNIGAGIAAPACTAKTAGKNVPGLQPVGRGNLITQRTRAFSPNVFKGSHLLRLQAVQVRPEVVVLERNFRVVLLRRARHLDEALPLLRRNQEASSVHLADPGLAFQIWSNSNSKLRKFDFKIPS